jgi:hypothetical protein
MDIFTFLETAIKSLSDVASTINYADYRFHYVHGQKDALQDLLTKLRQGTQESVPAEKVEAEVLTGDAA